MAMDQDGIMFQNRKYFLRVSLVVSLDWKFERETSFEGENGRFFCLEHVSRFNKKKIANTDFLKIRMTYNKTPTRRIRWHQNYSCKLIWEDVVRRIKYFQQIADLLINYDRWGLNTVGIMSKWKSHYRKRIQSPPHCLLYQDPPNQHTFWWWKFS